VFPQRYCYSTCNVLRGNPVVVVVLVVYKMDRAKLYLPDVLYRFQCVTFHLCITSAAAELP